MAQNDNTEMNISTFQNGEWTRRPEASHAYMLGCHVILSRNPSGGFGSARVKQFIEAIVVGVEDHSTRYLRTKWADFASDITISNDSDTLDGVMELFVKYLDMYNTHPVQAVRFTPV